MEQTKTSYAKNGDVNIAYQTVGDGPMDLVLVPGFISHLDLIWSFPEAAAFIRRLASFSRVILFDKRGTGLSDPISGIPTLEVRMEDLHAVLDAVESERAALFGISEGGPMSILFAATYPERTTAMVLYGTAASFVADEGSSPEQHDFVEELQRYQDQALAKEVWGEGDSVDVFAPSLAGDRAMREAWGLFERASASPAMARSLTMAVREINVTAALPAIAVPTLVLHRRDDRLIPVDRGRFMAAQIPGARFVELPGEDHFVYVGDTDDLLDEVEQFLTGARHTHEPDRVLSTVLFTDIVASTERASELGDRRWRGLLEAHDAGVRIRWRCTEARSSRAWEMAIWSPLTGPPGQFGAAERWWTMPARWESS
jgi:pimeloyl-ACP methyl ester carboxylesterase